MSYIPLLGQHPPLSYTGHRKPPPQPVLVGAEPVFVSPSYPTFSAAAAPTAATTAMSPSVRAVILVSMLCTVVAVVIGSVSLGILLPFRDETNARFGALENTTPATTTATSATTTTTTTTSASATTTTSTPATTTSAPATTTPSGSGGVDENTTAINVGTLGVGVFRDEIGDVLNFRNVAPGTYTTVVLDANDNIVVDVSATELATPDTIVLRNASAGFAASAISVGALANADALLPVDIGTPTVDISPTTTFYISELAGAYYYNPRNLYAYNLADNNSTLIGHSGTTIEGLTFTPNGTAYALAPIRQSPSLLANFVRVDTATAQVTVVCAGFTNFIPWTMYDETRAYAVQTAGVSFNQIYLYHLDTTTCAITTLQSTGLYLCGNMKSTGIFFRGKIYVYSHGPSGFGCGQFGVLDPLLAPNAILYQLNPNVNINQINRFGGLGIVCDGNGNPLIGIAGESRSITYYDPYSGVRVGNSPLLTIPSADAVWVYGSYCNMQNIPEVAALVAKANIDANKFALLNVGRLETPTITDKNGTVTIGNSTLNIQRGGSPPMLQFNQFSNLYALLPGTLKTDSTFTVAPYRTTNAAITALVSSPQLNLTTTGASVGAIGVLGTNTISESAGSTGGLLTFSVADAGTGYVVGNLLAVSGGSGTARLTVTTIDGNGGVLTFSLARPGSGYSVASGVATTLGAGTGATVNILSIGTSTYASTIGVQAQGIAVSGLYSTSTVTTATAFQVLNNNVGAGPIIIGTQVGLDVPTLTTVSTNAYGIRVATPTGGTAINNALNFVSSTTAAGGMTFGTDISLFRSAARFLRVESYVTTNAATTTFTGMTRLNVTTTGASIGAIGVLGTNAISASTGSTGGLLTFGVTAAGSGYVVGNILTVTGGSGTATLTVTTIDGGGGVLTFSLTRPGSRYSVASGVATTGGVGTGATVNILSIGTSTYTSSVGVQAQGITATGFFSTSTVTNAIALQVLQNDLGSGPITVRTQVGLDVPALTTPSTNAYGIRLAAPTGGTTLNNALNFVVSTTSAGGITYGEDAVTYRSGNSAVTHAGLHNSTGASNGSAPASVVATNIITASTGSTGGLLTFSVNVAGSGYVVGNILTVTGGSGTATLTVTTINGSGGVLTFSLTRPGSGYSVTSNVATTGGAGTLATVNILTIGSASYTILTGVQAQGFTANGMFSTANVATTTAFQVLQNNVGSGPMTIGVQLGLDVPALTAVSTNAYGIRVAAPTGGTNLNNALNFVSSTTAAGGITFGTDTNLYRSATGMLKTDTDLTVRDLIVRRIYPASAAIPTAVAGTGAGTGATVTVAAGSTDCKMRITVLTGSAPVTATVIATVYYNVPFTGTVNPGITFSAASIPTAMAMLTTPISIGAEALSFFTFDSVNTALAATTTYVWNFRVC